MNKVDFKPDVDLTFKSVVEVRAKLYQTLMDDKTNLFTLDLSSVKHCDSAGLALLIEARKLCKKSNKAFEVIGMPAETQALAEFCGVKSILQAV